VCVWKGVFSCCSTWSACGVLLVFSKVCCKVTVVCLLCVCVYVCVARSLWCVRACVCFYGVILFRAYEICVDVCVHMCVQSVYVEHVDCFWLT
jgi:hypothetical protein